MTIFSVTPLSSLTPSAPVSRADQAAEALARIAVIQTVETLGAMIDQSQSQSQGDLAHLAKDAVGEGELGRAKAADARAIAGGPEALVETPARAVAAAAGRAAARQAGLAPLMADMAQAAAEPDTPRQVKAAIDQVMALSTRLDGQVSGPEIRQALQRSGLFLEARLATAAPDGPSARPRTGTLTDPPRVVPTPTPNSDMKAALLVFREVVRSWADALPPMAAQAGAAATPTSGGATSAATPGASALAAAASAQQADRGTPQALAATTASPASSASRSMPPVPEAPVLPRADGAPPAVTRPPGGWPNVNAPSQVARPVVPQAPALPAFGAILADDLPAAPLARAASAAAMAYGGPEVGSGPPSQTPPPYAGAPTHAQAAAQPGLPAGAGPHAVAQRLLAETGAALARTELLQIASLPDPPAVGRPAEEHGQRWVFDMPFMTPQGPAAAQFEISRDGGGSGGEGAPVLGRTWRARFSLDVEPMGPVHAQVALTGDRARVSLWAERPAAMARLRTGEERLGSALREAALEPEIAFHAGQPRAPAAAPGQFLDQAT
ncbi:flagellar hook-length control protein FliK [Caulobacter sp. BE254]|uniref:flagellar hook-length control protein FliK n=1 Tax=Caulobacter sp. BE254 TaxID=2817720 RepID=UPI002861D3CA|nr:flagellar hook-length control protein FliK [Caulobacter sp. BE254]MDR7115942.1 hypothetical protein [Caulobacter sp. BE254]